MKKIALFTLAFAFLSSFANAQEAEEGQIPPGMEVIQDGRIKVIVPQDSKRRQEGNLTVVETTEAYASRKFLAIDERLVEIEAKQTALEKELEQLNKSLSEIKEKLNKFSFEQ